MSDKPHIAGWPETYVRGSKRTNVGVRDGTSLDGDWFEGHGKSWECRFEGTWWDMVCFARNVMASENTRLAAPEYHRPEWATDRYTGPTPYTFGGPTGDDDA